MGEDAELRYASTRVRNIAIIAHVDHGKTTLIDRLLQHCGALGRGAAKVDRALDTDDLERERGITILSKSTAIDWEGWRINIVDTPGHADFGGEVERVLSMVDSVLLLVDAVEGPMPQTRFVTEKALARGLDPIVAINKVDRDGARADWVLDRTFDLFDRLGANERQLDFPVVYTSALHGYAGSEGPAPGLDMRPLLEVVVAHTPPPAVDAAGAFQMQISTLDYSPYVGPIGIGRVQRGRVRPNSPVLVLDRDGGRRNARVLEVMRSRGLERHKVDEAPRGRDRGGERGGWASSVRHALRSGEGRGVAAAPGRRADGAHDPSASTPHPSRAGTGATSPAGICASGSGASSSTTSRSASKRPGDPDRFLVCGRGELHLAILIENMRREGYELAVAAPEVIYKTVDGRECEPFEQLSVDVEEISHR